MEKIEVKETASETRNGGFSRCARCGREIYWGEGCYWMDGRLICEDCFPAAAAEWLQGFYMRLGQEVRL